VTPGRRVSEVSGPAIESLGIGRAKAHESAAGHVAGLALLTCCAGLVLSGLVDLSDGGHETTVLIGWGAVLGIAGAALRHVFVLPSRVRADAALNAVLAGSLAMVVASAGAYVLTRTFTRVDDALFESVAGITTTALSVLEDPEATSRGVLFWRALTQWIGGFSALVVIIAVLPFLGVGGPQGAEARTRAGAGRLVSPPRTRRVNS
jgi:trk system potassium uptake protein TrkH